MTLRPPPLPPSGGPCEDCLGQGSKWRFPFFFVTCTRCRGARWLTSDQRMRERPAMNEYTRDDFLMDEAEHSAFYHCPAETTWDFLLWVWYAYRQWKREAR